MKKILLVAGLLVASVITVWAQNFEGIAIYQSSRSGSPLTFKAEGVTPEMQKQLTSQLSKQFQKEYELKFKLAESYWKEVESLEGGQVQANVGGMSISLATDAGATYINTRENVYLKESNVMGKPFLVKDVPEMRHWELTDETKQIGKYTVLKAIYKNIRESKSFTFGTDEEDKMETRMDTTHIEAWYAPEIPVSQGPNGYWGLPGLILELTDGSMSYLCTKLTLNPNNQVVIKQPSKGKVVSEEELKEIRDKQMEEMMKRSKNSEGSFIIKGGGGQ